MSNYSSTAKYMLWGGGRFTSPTVDSDEGVVFDTFEEAFEVWCSHLSDHAFPTWGDGVNIEHDYVIIFGNEAETFDGWTLADAVDRYDKDNSKYVVQILTENCTGVTFVGPFDTLAGANLNTQHEQHGRFIHRLRPPISGLDVLDYHSEDFAESVRTIRRWQRTPSE